MSNTFVGTWETTWDSATGSHPGFTVTVTESFRSRSGDFLDGMYDLTGRLPGAMHGELLPGNIWKGDWLNSPTDKGQFVLTLGNDSFTGTYNFEGKKEQMPWYSTRLKRRHTTAL